MRFEAHADAVGGTVEGDRGADGSGCPNGGGSEGAIPDNGCRASRAIHPKFDVFENTEELERSRRSTNKVIAVMVVIVALIFGCLIAMDWNGNGAEDDSDPYAGYYAGDGTFFFYAEPVYGEPYAVEYDYRGATLMFIRSGWEVSD